MNRFLIFPGQTSNKKAAAPVERPAALQKQFSLSPNPTQGLITLVWDKEEIYPLEDISIKVTDLQGKLLLSQSAVNADLERTLLNLETLSNGTYLIEVSHNAQTLFNEKVVLQK